MGEDTFIYAESEAQVYSNSFPVKLEQRDGEVATNGILPYNLGGGVESSDPYSSDHTNSIARAAMDGANNKYIPRGALDTSFSNRPTLHHMPSLSATSCNSDSFHESGELTGYGYAAGEPQEFEWAIQPSAFQWPNNHSLATPPLESPISFAQFHAYRSNGQDSRPPFPTAIPTPTEYYPLSATSQTSAQAMAFQAFTQESPQMMYSRSSGENSQSTTPRLHSPPLISPPMNRPAPTKMGSVSADVPTARNRRQSEADTVGAPTSTREVARRRASTSLSATHHHLSRSPNRSHQRRSSAMPSLAVPLAGQSISEDPFDEKPTLHLPIKRSSSSPFLVKTDGEDFVEGVFLQDPVPLPPTPHLEKPFETQQVLGENVSSGDDALPNESDQLAKTKQARAESEHRRRVELKESFERLRIVMNVPQPRAGKKDLVEQAIQMIEALQDRDVKRESHLQSLEAEVERLRAQERQYQLKPRSHGVQPPRWGQSEEMLSNGDEMDLS